MILAWIMAGLGQLPALVRLPVYLLMILATPAIGLPFEILSWGLPGAERGGISVE